ncbi:MAG TPA: YqgE/AlgH family protein, partial [Burkholderiales bacterium]
MAPVMRSNDDEGRLMKRAIGAFAACVLVFGAYLARANDLGKPMLLVATPSLNGPYSGTVLVAVPLDNKHFGFILNRSTGTPLAKAFPEHAPSAKVLDPIYFGGPELAQGLFAVRRGDPGQPSVRLFGDVFATGNARVVDAIIEQTPNDARYFAGFVGWQPEELAKEIASGYWYVGDAEEAQVLRRDTDTLWQELLERFGGAGAP